MMLDEQDKAQQVINEKLTPWFEEFGIETLRPQFLKLQAEYYRQNGEQKQAEEFKAEAEKLILEGREMISGKHLPEEVITYLDSQVEISGNKQLQDLYANVRHKLKDDFWA